MTNDLISRNAIEIGAISNKVMHTNAKRPGGQQAINVQNPKQTQPSSFCITTVVRYLWIIENCTILRNPIKLNCDKTIMA